MSIMDDEGEIDIIGDYNSFENILKKNEDQIISTCYDEDQLGLQCDSRWMMVDSSSQPCWDDNQTDPQSSLGFPVETPNSDVWSEKEKYLLEKGLELFGRSWSRLSQYIGTKNSSQVKTYVKSTGIGWSGRSSISMSNFSVDIVDFEFSDVMDDMEIPASMEEVIAAVSTAQPTVVVPSSHREPNAAALSSSSRRINRRYKKSNSSIKSHIITQSRKRGPNVFNAEEIKDVFPDLKEKDSITLPNGEEVIRIRSGESLSEESEVDVDIDSDLEDSKKFVPKITVLGRESHEEKIVPEIVDFPNQHCVEDTKRVDPEIANHDNDILEETIVPEIVDFGNEPHAEEIVPEIVNFDTKPSKEEEEEDDPLRDDFDIKKESKVVIDETVVLSDSDDDNKEKIIPSQFEFVEEVPFVDVNSELDFCLDNIEKEECVFTESDSNQKEESHVFRGSLVTPSGKVMTVVLDDVAEDDPPSPKSVRKPIKSAVNEYMETINARLHAVYQLPPPLHEVTIDSHTVTEEEQRLHPEFFDNRWPSHHKYLKIRTHIINCWKKSKPKYVTKTSVRTGLMDGGDVNLVSRIHAYLEQKGVINFGCEECLYNSKTPVIHGSKLQKPSIPVTRNYIGISKSKNKSIRKTPMTQRSKLQRLSISITGDGISNNDSTGKNCMIQGSKLPISITKDGIGILNSNDESIFKTHMIQASKLQRPVTKDGIGTLKSNHEIIGKTQGSKSQKPSISIIRDDIGILESNDESMSKNQDVLSKNVENGKRVSSRIRKKKVPFGDAYYDSSKLVFDISCLKKNNSTENLEASNSWISHKNISNPNTNEGFTMIHTDSGEVIVQHNQVKPSAEKSRRIKPVKLIHCKNYSSTNKAPYKVEVEISALLLVDVHSHLSPICEVIGLLGGRYRPEKNLLSITTAVPCRTVLSSNVHCDMCPVSQCEGSELITSQGLTVLGWYHSHPNFDPSPSDTDVDTQNTLQSWFNKTGMPFVGLIISPYYTTDKISTFRICQVKMENNGPVPYQLDVKLVNLEKIDIKNFKQSIEAALSTLESNKLYNYSTVMKCQESLRHHMRQVKMTAYNCIINQIGDILKQNVYKVPDKKENCRQKRKKT